MNSRFSIAVHILSLLASNPEERLTSDFIALSIGTNAVVIRRQLALLRRAKLVDSKGAKGGGWLLARRPAEISLKDVRLALGTSDAFTMHKNSPHPACLVGKNVRSALGSVYRQADVALAESLNSWSIQDVVDAIRNL